MNTCPFWVQEGGDGHTSAEFSSLEVVQYLIKQGSDINAKTIAGESVLLMACFNNYFEISEYLITLGLDINEADCFGDTPLHVTFKKGFSALSKRLIDIGADMYSKDNSRRSALSYCNDPSLQTYCLKMHLRSTVLSIHNLLTSMVRWNTDMSLNHLAWFCFMGGVLSNEDYKSTLCEIQYPNIVDILFM